MKILVAEDEPRLALHVRRALERVGHEVTSALEGPGAIAAATSEKFDLVVLDIGLPGCDGFEVLQSLRKREPLPRILILTARTEVEDRVAGLRAGADDYVTKPFSMDELLARVDALSRRGDRWEPSSSLRAGGLLVEIESRRVTQGGQRIGLSPREFEVLLFLMREPGRVFSRDEISKHVWERKHEDSTRRVEIFIARLRKKLDPELAKVRIETVRGVGYVLRTME